MDYMRKSTKLCLSYLEDTHADQTRTNHSSGLIFQQYQKKERKITKKDKKLLKKQKKSKTQVNKLKKLQKSKIKKKSREEREILGKREQEQPQATAGAKKEHRIVE